MPPKSKKNLGAISPKSSSPKNKTKRCPKGEYRNPKTGICEKKGEKTMKMTREKQKLPRQIEPKKPPKNLSKMTMKEKDIYEKRKSCIKVYRDKLPSLIEKESQENESEENTSEPKPESAEKTPPKTKKTLKQKRCPKDEYRNPKTGVCEKKV